MGLAIIPILQVEKLRLADLSWQTPWVSAAKGYLSFFIKALAIGDSQPRLPITMRLVTGIKFQRS